MAAMIRTNITLDPKTVAWLRMIANLTGASKSEIIRRGVEAYIREMGTNMQRNLPALLREQGFELDNSGEIVGYEEPAKKKKTERKRAATRKRS